MCSWKIVCEIWWNQKTKARWLQHRGKHLPAWFIGLWQSSDVCAHLPDKRCVMWAGNCGSMWMVFQSYIFQMFWRCLAVAWKEYQQQLCRRLQESGREEAKWEIGGKASGFRDMHGTFSCLKLSLWWQATFFFQTRNAVLNFELLSFSPPLNIKREIYEIWTLQFIFCCMLENNVWPILHL